MKTWICVAFTICLFTSFNAAAGPQWCSGSVEKSWVNKNGNLYIFGSWRKEHTQICNINNTWNGVSPEICKSWLSIVLAAKMSSTPVTVQYADVPSCSEIPKYESSPSPEYVMTK